MVNTDNSANTFEAESDMINRNTSTPFDYRENLNTNRKGSWC